MRITHNARPWEPACIRSHAGFVWTRPTETSPQTATKGFSSPRRPPNVSPIQFPALPWTSPLLKNGAELLRPLLKFFSSEGIVQEFSRYIEAVNRARWWASHCRQIRGNSSGFSSWRKIKRTSSLVVAPNDPSSTDSAQIFSYFFRIIPSNREPLLWELNSPSFCGQYTFCFASRNDSRLEEGLNWRSRNALVAARVCQVACNCKIRDADIFIFQGLVILLSCLPSIFPTEARNQRVLHAKRTRLKFLHNGSIINDSRVWETRHSSV